jgi:uncharacterized cupredoxin-like copper-binding protein
MRSTIRLSLVLALAAAVVFPAHRATAATDWSKAQTVSVELVDYRFIPDRLVFRQGVAYRLHLENEGHELHEFTAPEFLKAVEIGNPEVVGSYGAEIVLQPGDKKDLLFLARAPGTYKLTCSDHDWEGMVGEIVVE